MMRITFLVLFLSAVQMLSGQHRGINRDKYQIQITKTETKPKLDGILDDLVWSKADVASQFQRVLPTDTGYAIAQTEVRLCYTQTHLYVGVICYDPTAGKRPVESLRRDWNFMKNDNFIVFIDTYNDQTNGFAFGINAAGAQWDGLQANGGSVNLNWDTKWKTAVQNYDDRWVAEYEIPFRSLRYHGGEMEWGINFSRQDLKSGEKSSWAPMPRQFATATLAYTGSLVWDEPLPGAGARFSFIPYATARAVTHSDPGSDHPYRLQAGAGADAKVILSTSMNLDLTILPDYSQVEVDRQQTNLDRYELFFPEKRQFFLENSDLFANLGNTSLRPFFSRRIGLENPVLAGARLSGKMGDNWRIGLMDMHTSAESEGTFNNYAVAAVQRKIFGQSTVSAFLVNRQLFGNESNSSSNEFNRVAGAEFNLASQDNRWTGKSFYHQSFNPESQQHEGAFANSIRYATQFWLITIDQAWVGENYEAEVGYIRRNGYFRLNPEIRYRFFPNHRTLANHGPILEMDTYLDAGWKITDRVLEAGYQWTWLNTSTLTLDYTHTYVKLPFAFDPLHSDGEKFAEGTEFNWNEGALAFSSDIRKSINLLAELRYGSYYNGTKLTMANELFFRVQPWGALAVVSSFNRVRLPEPYSSADLFLIGPRLDITFTRHLFFTGLVQYNNQINNLNINARLQWRFAPASDLYLVYTENSNPLDFQVKDRGLVIKLSYWIN